MNRVAPAPQSALGRGLRALVRWVGAVAATVAVPDASLALQARPPLSDNIARSDGMQRMATTMSPIDEIVFANEDSRLQ
jgi:hypothetical protein